MKTFRQNSHEYPWMLEFYKVLTRLQRVLLGFDMADSYNAVKLESYQ